MLQSYDITVSAAIEGGPVSTTRINLKEPNFRMAPYLTTVQGISTDAYFAKTSGAPMQLADLLLPILGEGDFE